ncbi:MAG: H-NS histone family protein, partial [Neisseriaceae bacterium]|nr:H-NS histone family protein [Neisseriaceae bacterium]
MEQLDQKTQKRIAELAKQQQKIAAEISKLKNQRSAVVRDIVAKMDKYNVSLADVQEYLNNRKRYVNPTTGETWS